MENNDLKEIIEVVFDEIGFEREYRQIFCRAVELVLENEDMLHNLAKSLYPKIAKEFNREKSADVERDLRNAIENAYVREAFVKLNRLFKAELYTKEFKPTIGELIRLVAEYCKLGLYE